MTDQRSSFNRQWDNGRPGGGSEQANRIRCQRGHPHCPTDPRTLVPSARTSRLHHVEDGGRVPGVPDLGAGEAGVRTVERPPAEVPGAPADPALPDPLGSPDARTRPAPRAGDDRAVPDPAVAEAPGPPADGPEPLGGRHPPGRDKAVGPPADRGGVQNRGGPPDGRGLIARERTDAHPRIPVHQGEPRHLSQPTAGPEGRGRGGAGRRGPERGQGGRRGHRTGSTDAGPGRRATAAERPAREGQDGIGEPEGPGGEDGTDGKTRGSGNPNGSNPHAMGPSPSLPPHRSVPAVWARPLRGPPGRSDLNLKGTPCQGVRPGMPGIVRIPGIPSWASAGSGGTYAGLVAPRTGLRDSVSRRRPPGAPPRSSAP
jgi:hypothetical protein